MHGGTATLASNNRFGHYNQNFQGMMIMRRKRNGIDIRRYALAVTIATASTMPSLSFGQQRGAPIYPSVAGLTPAQGLEGDRSLLVPTEGISLNDLIDDVDEPDLNIIDVVGSDEKESDSRGAVVTSELLQQRTADGRIHIERWVTEDASGNLVNNGLYKEYDTKGAVIRIGEFNMGKLNGAWKQTIPLAAVQQIAGTIDAGFRAPFQSEANFVDGELSGDWTITDATGHAVLVMQFEDGFRNGASLWLSSRGKVVRELHYKNGVLDGPAIIATTTQREPERIVYYQGKVLKSRTVWYDPDRRTKKKYEESFLVASGDRLVSHDWWNTQISTETVSATGEVRHGKLLGWHPNGSKSVEGEFVNDLPVGQFQWWYASGQLLCEGAFDDGAKSGTWAWWHPNGMKMLVGDFDRGDQVGVWSHWSAEGKLVQRDVAEKFPQVHQDILPEEIDRQNQKDGGVARQSHLIRPNNPTYRATTPSRLFR